MARPRHKGCRLAPLVITVLLGFYLTSPCVSKVMIGCELIKDHYGLDNNNTLVSECCQQDVGDMVTIQSAISYDNTSMQTSSTTSNVEAKTCRQTLATIISLHPVCLPETMAGEKVQTPCPAKFKNGGNVSAECQSDGQWNPHLDYSECWSEKQHERCVSFGRWEAFIKMYTVGYSVSMVSLIIAIVILASFRRLHCTRNFIHIHLFTSGVFKAAFILLRDHISGMRADLLKGVHICLLVKNDLHNFDHSMLSPPSYSQAGCKVAVTLFNYFMSTMYFWVLVEALYLHNLIFVAVFSEKKNLKWFVLLGWGAPLLFILPWVAVNAVNDDGDCWRASDPPEYGWIYRGPISVIIVVNFLLFLNIVRVLAEKLRGAAAAGSPDSGGSCCCRWPEGISWRLAKSTLVLIPLFGVSGIIFVFMPPKTGGDARDVRFAFDLFLNSFQGFFLAVLFCFLNGEVQAEFKKRWERWQMSRDLSYRSTDRSRLPTYQIPSTRSNSLALTQVSCAPTSSAPFLTPDQTPYPRPLPKITANNRHLLCPDHAGKTSPPDVHPNKTCTRLNNGPHDYSSVTFCELIDVQESSFVTNVSDQQIGD